MLQDALATLIILVKVTVKGRERPGVNVSLPCYDHLNTSAIRTRKNVWPIFTSLRLILKVIVTAFMFTNVVQLNVFCWFMLVCKSVCP